MTSSKNSQVGKDSLMLIFPVVALNMLCMQWMLGVTTFCDPFIEHFPSTSQRFTALQFPYQQFYTAISTLTD